MKESKAKQPSVVCVITSLCLSDRNEVFPESNMSFIEISEFGESDKSLKHGLGPIQRSLVSCGHSASISVSFTRG